MVVWKEFREMWLVDSEYQQDGGESPRPICIVARELNSGQVLRLFGDELTSLKIPPFPVDADTLIVVYYAPADLGCFLVLGWPLPRRILDLFAEFRCCTNGIRLPNGNSLLGALSHHGLDCMEAVEKATMRDLASRGGPYTTKERHALLDYCQSDVDALATLFEKMAPTIDLPRALFRGQYMAAVAQMEATGVPIDVPMLNRLNKNWETLKMELLKLGDQHGLWVNGKFSSQRFTEFIEQRNIRWPRTPKSNAYRLDDDTMKAMSKSYPEINSIRELRHTLSQLRLNSLNIGRDGRNRCMLSPFASKTGRNQPSNSKFIFGPSVWIRGLIKPPQGRAIAYIDWSQQEFGIAAALSTDDAMLWAYQSGDPYLAFAIQAGAVPADATKESHPIERSRFKACALGVLYGMGVNSLATRLNVDLSTAKTLLNLHKRTYRRYWQWQDNIIDIALLGIPMKTVFGWTYHVPSGNPNVKSIGNFPMQANGAEMLRAACYRATIEGISICAPVHDAVLIEDSLESIEDTAVRMQEIMAQASKVVLQNLTLRTDVDIVRYPDRYSDPRGTEMWNTVMAILDGLPD